MTVRKLEPDEVTSTRSPLLRWETPSDETTGFVAQYVIELDQADGLEGHRIYWGQVVRFLSEDGRYEHGCVSTILGHSMSILAIVRDRIRGEIVGHYFANGSDFPWDEQRQSEPNGPANASGT